MKHPYQAGIQGYWQAEKDFDNFATNALVSIPEILNKLPRAGALQKANGFLVRKATPTTLQAWFGKRTTGRLRIGATDPDVEDGAYLVYSLVSTGDVAAILYPARSEGAIAQEEHLILGFWKSNKLADRLESHLKTLVAYQYVTSIDGQPTRGERIKVGWLRLVCLRSVNGQHTVAMKLASRCLAGMATHALFAAIFRILLFAVFILLLIWLGYDRFAALLAKRI
jgi:hypothetical protein